MGRIAGSARDRILDAAVVRIARDGLDEARIARIARDAGVSPSLVHYHFASREALLAEALEHSYELAGDVRIGEEDEGSGSGRDRSASGGDRGGSGRDRSASGGDRSGSGRDRSGSGGEVHGGAGGDGRGGPVAERLRAMIDQCLPHPGPLERDWVLWVELWLRAVRHPELRPTAARLYGRMHEWFAAAVEEGTARGEWPAVDADRLADRILALLDGYGVRALLSDPELDLERARTETWAAVATELEPADVA